MTGRYVRPVAVAILVRAFSTLIYWQQMPLAVRV